MNENSINQVHSMLEETDTLISSSCKSSGHTIVNMIECLALALFLVFYSNNTEYALIISVTALTAVFINLYVLGDHKTKIKMFEACSTSFKEKHLSEPSIRAQYEDRLYEDLTNLLEVTERYVKLYKLINIINAITGAFMIILFVMALIQFHA